MKKKGQDIEEEEDEEDGQLENFDEEEGEEEMAPNQTKAKANKTQETNIPESKQFLGHQS